ncbi:MAG: phage holin family protein [Candidatus Eremiobacteraeota bacterium]|nr:phage holin family protein [Candidatus Eremiobacteraeota bacterium]
MAEFRQEADLHDLPIGDLLKRLSHETTLLLRQEIDLAKAEVSEKGKQAGKGASMFGAAGVAALAAVGALTAFLIIALSSVMAAWLAALIVTIVYGVVAFVLAQSGKHKFAAAKPLMPTQTIQTLKEDVQWAKTRAGSARR